MAKKPSYATVPLKVPISGFRGRILRESTNNGMVPFRGEKANFSAERRLFSVHILSRVIRPQSFLFYYMCCGRVWEISLDQYTFYIRLCMITVQYCRFSYELVVQIRAYTYTPRKKT